MSRRHALPHAPGVEVVVGWDPPLATFFAQVIRQGPAAAADDEEDDDVLLWVGTAPGDIAEPEGLRGPLAPWAELDDATVAALRADRAAAVQPSDLQRIVLRGPWIDRLTG